MEHLETPQAKRIINSTARDPKSTRYDGKVQNEIQSSTPNNTKAQNNHIQKPSYINILPRKGTAGSLKQEAEC